MDYKIRDIRNALYRVHQRYTKAVHLLFPQFTEETDPAQRRLGIFFGLVLQSKCREVWVFGRNITKGMAVEIEKAKERGLPIRYFTEQCGEVAGK